VEVEIDTSAHPTLNIVDAPLRPAPARADAGSVPEQAVTANGDTMHASPNGAPMPQATETLLHTPSAQAQ
ncbi:MAG: hypothetical protein ACREKI_02425, partial [Gemmatimonadota bacterium]